MNEALEFQLEEYKALRKEVELYITEVRSQERYAVIAVGVVWGWLIAQKQTHWLLWLIPILITGAAWLRLVAMPKHIGNVGERIRQIETAFKVEGWEHASWRSNMLQRVNTGLTVILFVLASVGWFLRFSIVANINPYR